MGKRRKGELIITANHHIKPVWTYLRKTEGIVPLLLELLSCKKMWSFNPLLQIQLS